MAVGETASVLCTALDLPAAGSAATATAAVLLGIGPTAQEAREMVGIASAKEVVAAAENVVQAWLRARRLPTTGSDRVRAVARRSLLNLRVSTHVDTGAIVASIARQPPYGLDWPRDAAIASVAPQRGTRSRRARSAPMLARSRRTMR